MVKKERNDPPGLKMEEALLRRLPRNHEKRGDISENIRKGRAGFKGEKELDYHLTFLPEDQYLIFNDLRLPDQNRFFQIDTLILTPQAAIVIESKNIYGHLFFDSTTNQVIRTFDNKKEGFPDPILQAKRHKNQLSKWLSPFMTRPIPIHYMVSIGHPSTIVETDPGNYHIFKHIFHAEHIPEQIEEFIKKHPETQLSAYQLRKISTRLLEDHTPKRISILATYRISPTELLQGIICPQCSTIPMKRKHGTWYCAKCNHLTKDAHVQVIEDHLEIHRTITNKQCRDLLVTDRSYTVKRLLLSMGLDYTGGGSDRVYFRGSPGDRRKSGISAGKG